MSSAELVIGSKWGLRDESPWPKTNNVCAEIIDVKDGWVRYAIGTTFPDERLKADTFLKIYAPVEDSDAR